MNMKTYFEERPGGPAAGSNFEDGRAEEFSDTGPREEEIATNGDGRASLDPEQGSIESFGEGADDIEGGRKMDLPQEEQFGPVQVGQAMLAWRWRSFILNSPPTKLSHLAYSVPRWTGARGRPGTSGPLDYG